MRERRRLLLLRHRRTSLPRFLLSSHVNYIKSVTPYREYTTPACGLITKLFK